MRNGLWRSQRVQMLHIDLRDSVPVMFKYAKNVYSHYFPKLFHVFPVNLQPSSTFKRRQRRRFWPGVMFQDVQPGICIRVLQRHLSMPARCAPSGHVIRLYCTGDFQCQTERCLSLLLLNWISLFKSSLIVQCKHFTQQRKHPVVEITMVVKI